MFIISVKILVTQIGQIETFSKYSEVKHDHNNVFPEWLMAISPLWFSQMAKGSLAQLK